MKMMRFGILVILILVGIGSKNSKVYAKGLADRELVYRPITLTVLDVETGQPLEGITITAGNVIGYSKYVWGDSITYRFSYIYKYITNEQGIVEIPEFRYRVDRHHYLASQVIALNIELKDENIDIEQQARRFTLYNLYDNEMFFRPYLKYKACRVLCDTDQPWEQSERIKPYAMYIHKRYKAEERKKDQTSFFTGHEEFTVYLERFVAP